MVIEFMRFHLICRLLCSSKYSELGSYSQFYQSGNHLAIQNLEIEKRSSEVR